MNRHFKTSFTITILLAILYFQFFLPSSKPKYVAPPVVPTATQTIIPSTTTASTTPTQAITPSPVPATLTPQSPPDPQFYTVLKGETLGEIASKLGLSVEDLALANHITDINLIYAGQELYIGSTPIIAPEPTVLVGKQIIVILSTQRAYAFENGVLAHPEFIVATGMAAYPTVTGNYEIYVKYESTPMSGPGYSIPNVPWTMYFYQGYALHGAPWNHNLGHPGSHGCVNMSVEDAEWLFNWAPVGTPVLILP